MKYLLLLFISAVLISCQRELPETSNNNPVPDIDCYLLKQGIRESSIEKITESLGNLLDREYSNDNLNQLADDISSNCDVSASLQCFDCIKTDPPQSVMNVGILEDNGDSTKKELNLIPGVNLKTIELVSVQ
jgi:hypothetical protein